MTCAASCSDRTHGTRREIKLVLAARHVEETAAWLDHLCAPDPEYRHNTIRSLYFDTPALHSLDEKIQSDFLKCKLRLRWYTDAQGALSESAFLEIKRKAGHRSFKKRYPVKPDPILLQARPIEAGINLDLSEIVTDDNYSLIRNMLPFCVITYRRRRYIDMQTGLRISLDSSIGVSHVNPRFHPPGGPGQINWAVLEVKGPNASGLPEALFPLQAFDLVKTAFSKYAECVNHLLLRKG